MAKRKRPKEKVMQKERVEPEFEKVKIRLIFKPANKVIFMQEVTMEVGMPEKIKVDKFLSQFSIHFEKIDNTKKLLIVQGGTIKPYVKQ